MVYVYWGLYIVGAIIGISFVLNLISETVFRIEERQAGIVQRWGRFHKVANPGLNWKVPLIDELIECVSLRVQQLDVRVETRTKDDTIVGLDIAVMFFVSDASSAHYKLTDRNEQVSSWISDVVLAQVPLLDLPQVFEQREQIANAIRDQLADSMEEFGYKIHQALIKGIHPAPEIITAMNEVKASERRLAAAKNDAEGLRVREVAKAEAEKISKELQGKGIAIQRVEIASGYATAIQTLREALGGQDVNEHEVSRMLLMTQHYDTLSTLADSGNVKVIFVPYTPNSVTDIDGQIRTAIMQADAAFEKSA